MKINRGTILKIITSISLICSSSAAIISMAIPEYAAYAAIGWVPCQLWIILYTWANATEEAKPKKKKTSTDGNGGKRYKKKL